MHRLKQIVKRLVERYLCALVKVKLRRVHPTIVGITGSYGKTSTKDAVSMVLATKYRVLRSHKGLNTEIGLLLAFLEQPSGFDAPLAWLGILNHAWVNAFWGPHYDYAVLEYGADKPGDIEHLVKILKPHISIITHVACVHQDEDQFKSIDEVFMEKKKLVTCLHASDFAILNGADNRLASLMEKLSAHTAWFNNVKGISATHLVATPTGFSAKIHLHGKTVPAEFYVPGTYHIDVMLAALMCGVLCGVSLEEGVEALAHFKLPPGRMGVIEGKNGATLLDSTYNASPETVKQALNLLREFPGERRIAVLGNMNELGEYTPAAHREVGDHIAPWLNLLITVGNDAEEIVAQALKKGFPKARMKSFCTAEEAARFLYDYLEKDTVILLKGSQNRVRLERAVKLLMAHPEMADKLLCRQEEVWENL